VILVPGKRTLAVLGLAALLLMAALLALALFQAVVWRSARPTSSPAASLERGPYASGGYEYVVFWVPCSVAEPQGVAVLMAYPREPRFREGAPVVICVPGGREAGTLPRLSERFDPHGVIWLYFLLPGGEAGEIRSGGEFDYRGRASVEALYAVAQFAEGRLRNTAGKLISDYVGYNVLVDEVGLYARSNGGNLAGLLFASHSTGLEGIKYIVFYESPVGDHYVQGDLGKVKDDPNKGVDADGDGIPWDDFRNLMYVEGSCNETSCRIDFTNLDYDPRAGFYLDNNHDGKLTAVSSRGQLTTDVDGSGALEEDEDFVFRGWEVTYKGRSRVVYSMEVTLAAAKEGLFSKAPPEVMRPSEALEFWLERDISYHYDEISANAPWLKVMQLGFTRDHMQAARDHPHIVVNYNAFKSRGHWVRLNPDKSYIEHVTGRKLKATENAANIDINFSNILKHLLDYPDRGAVGIAAVLEMVDRAHFNNWAPNLDAALLKASSSSCLSCKSSLASASPVEAAGMVSLKVEGLAALTMTSCWRLIP